MDVALGRLCMCCAQLRERKREKNQRVLCAASLNQGSLVAQSCIAKPCTLPTPCILSQLSNAIADPAALHCLLTMQILCRFRHKVVELEEELAQAKSEAAHAKSEAAAAKADNVALVERLKCVWGGGSLCATS